MVQYPHFLFVHVVSESVRDSEGNWTTPTSSWVLHSICREETNGKGTVIMGTDGKAIVFSSIVFMPRTAAKIPENTEVIVSDVKSESEQIRIKGPVLKFNPGQLHCRLWI